MGGEKRIKGGTGEERVGGDKEIKGERRKREREREKEIPELSLQSVISIQCSSESREVR